ATNRWRSGRPLPFVWTILTQSSPSARPRFAVPAPVFACRAPFLLLGQHLLTSWRKDQSTLASSASFPLIYKVQERSLWTFALLDLALILKSRGKSACKISL